MKVYDIVISGIEICSKTFSIEAETLPQACDIAWGMVKAKRENGWKDADLVSVELNCEITEPKQFIDAAPRKGEKANPKR